MSTLGLVGADLRADKNQAKVDFRADAARDAVAARGAGFCQSSHCFSSCVAHVARRNLCGLTQRSALVINLDRSIADAAASRRAPFFNEDATLVEQAQFL